MPFARQSTPCAAQFTPWVQSEPNPINIAYSNVGLDPHVDLAYLESPPGLQFLHCLQFDDDVVGGLSTLVDVFEAAEVRVTCYCSLATGVPPQRN